MAVPEILNGIKVFLDDRKKVRNFCTITAITPAICLYFDVLGPPHGDDTEDELDMDELVIRWYDSD